ncbi:hypothetical protein TPMD03_25 [Thiohalocapsa phage LS06-2018-MD03]|nr:hypothetical protein TPMD03_25 [Thiohalocapsa phage LS06-2018-MD03]
MSKGYIRALIEAQVQAASAKDNKERLRYVVAGVKDGRFYTHAGMDFGEFLDKDGNTVSDTIFISDTDLQLSRITGAKLKSIETKIKDFFEEHLGDADDSEDVAEQIDDNLDDAEAETPSEDGDVSCDEADDEISSEDLAKEVKKLIKKEKFKAAKLLINKLGDEDKKLRKKLMKKLDKAESDD